MRTLLERAQAGHVLILILMHTHGHTHTHILSHSHSAVMALKAMEDLWEQPLPKNLLFPYGSNTLDDCQKHSDDVYVCVYLCI